MKVKEIWQLEDDVTQRIKVSIRVSFWDRLRYLLLGDALYFEIGYELTNKKRPIFFVE